MKIISIGEILWDVFPEVEHLGGAPFNFSAHAARLGHDVVFLTAVGTDDRGSRATAEAARQGLPSHFIQQIEGQLTGTAQVMLDSAGQPRFVINRPAAYDFLHLSESDFRRLAAYAPDWVYFGTLHQTNSQAREMTQRLLDATSARRFYDVNLRVDSYEPCLVRDLMAEADVVKLNEDEARVIQDCFCTAHGSLEEFCRNYSARFGWEAVCVTRGAAGCALLISGEWAEIPGCRVRVADTVGAGDAFAAAFIHGLGSGWPPARIGEFANRVGALVSSRAGGVPAWSIEEVEQISSILL